MDNEQSLKKPAIVGLAALAVLLAGAVVFYRERLFTDASYIVFNIINSSDLSIQGRRYGSFITQLAPYLSVKAHLPFKFILQAYSVSFNLFYVIVAGLIAFKLKQYRLAIIMVLHFFLFVTASYFWPVSEIHQALAWMFLLVGSTMYMGSTGVRFFLLVIFYLLLTFLTVFTHFIVIIPAIFLVTYFILEKTYWPFSRRKTVLLGCMFIFAIGVKYTISLSQSYDGQHLHDAIDFLQHETGGVFAAPVTQMFFQRCLVIYWPAIIVFIAGIASLVVSRKFLLAAWTCLSVAGYIMVMWAMYGKLDRDVQLFHIESEWTSLSIIISTPFVFSFLPRLKPATSSLLLALIFVIRLAYIGAAAPVFFDRLHLQEQILSQMRKKHVSKLALFMDRATTSAYIIPWTAPYESLFSSAMNGDRPQLTFSLVNKDDKQTRATLANNPACFDNVFSMMPKKDMNARYFNIDTTQPYVEMTYEELFK